ncbi:hypothetical protein L218DRAFT_990517 [Marasmius fiardii PR-910]|nr:hypothetical protein L218DRAFT_990517 [Marasmius fiardii PR-910]
MDDPSQFPSSHENSVVTIPNQTLSRSRNQTVVVERRRRRILLASKPGSSMPYRMVAVEDVEVVRTTTVHPSDVTESTVDHAESRNDEYEADKKPSDVSSKTRTTTGRARYINSFQPHHYHYLPNGPARRSRYNVPPKQQFKPPPTSFMTPTTHVIHPREGDDDAQNNYNYHRQTSPSPLPYSSTRDTAPDVHDSHPGEQGGSSSYSSSASSPPASHSRSRSQFDLKTPGSCSSDTYPLSVYSANQVAESTSQPFHSRFELHHHHPPGLGPPVVDNSTTTNSRVGLGSREHELMELREFWKEFYGS